MVVHEDLCVGEAKERRQVFLDVADERLERTVLNEALHESDHSVFHLIFVLLLNLVREDLHANPRQA